MAATLTSRTKALEESVVALAEGQEAIMAAIQALAPPKEEADTSAKPKTTRKPRSKSGSKAKAQPKAAEYVPFLSCWTQGEALLKDAGETFVGTTKKFGKRTYVVLSEDEIIELVKVNLAAGRKYAKLA